MKQALGLVEIEGLSTAMVVADTMAKAANIRILEIENTKGLGYMTIKITGDVGAVNAAVNAGRQVGITYQKLVSWKVIPRPSDYVEHTFCEPNPPGPSSPSPDKKKEKEPERAEAETEKIEEQAKPEAVKAAEEAKPAEAEEVKAAAEAKPAEIEEVKAAAEPKPAPVKNTPAAKKAAAAKRKSSKEDNTI